MKVLPAYKLPSQVRHEDASQVDAPRAVAATVLFDQSLADQSAWGRTHWESTHSIQDQSGGHASFASVASPIP